MVYVVVLFLLYVVLMVFPFVLGFASPRKSPEERSLFVRDNNLRDPRYFSKSFIRLVEKAWPEREKNKIRLSKEESYLEGDMLAGKRKIDSIVIAENKFYTENSCEFSKEIFAKKSAGLGKNNHVRAIACQEELTLQEGCIVDRWLDSELTLRIHKNCRIGISATSGERVVAEAGCIYRRIYAPEIIIGQDKDIRCRLRCAIYAQEKVSRDILWDCGQIEEGEHLENTIICRDNLKIGKNAVIYGDVKSEKSIHLCSGVMVTGNLIADGEITMEEGIIVRGNVFSQDSIYIGRGCTVGECGMLKSVVARERVKLCVGTVIYGYISGEKDGEILEEDDFFREIQHTY